MNISFAWTTEALLEGKKDVTRRDWTDKYAKMFLPEGSEHVGWNKSARFGGKRVCRIRTVSLRREPIMKLLEDPEYGEEEIKREGGLWANPEEFVVLFMNRGIVEPIRYEFGYLGKIGE